MLFNKLFFYLILLVACISVGCGDRVNSNQVKSRQNRSKEIDTAQIIDKLVDYLNYNISRYAAKTSDDDLNYFDSVIKERNDRSYASIVKAIPVKNDKSIALSNEIEQLKDVLISIKDTASIFAYLGSRIYEDTIQWKRLSVFYDKRIKRFSRDNFILWLDSVNNNIRDSIKNMYSSVFKPVREIPTDSTTRKTSNTGLKSNSRSPITNLLFYVPLAILIILLLATAYNFFKDRKKGRLKKHENSNELESNEYLRRIKELEATELDLKKRLKALEKDKEELIQINKNLNRKGTDLGPSTERVQDENKVLQQIQPRKVQEKSESTDPEFFFPAPKGDAFPVSLASSTKRPYDAYVLKIKGEAAFFSLIIEDAALVKRVLESPDSYILTLCEFEMGSVDTGKAKGIKVTKPGVLRKEGDQWRLKDKSIITLF